MSYWSPKRAYSFTSLFVLQPFFFPFHLFYKPFPGIFFPEVLNEAWAFRNDHLEPLRLLWWVESTYGGNELLREGRDHSPPSWMNAAILASVVNWNVSAQGMRVKDRWASQQGNFGRYMEKFKAQTFMERSRERFLRESKKRSSTAQSCMMLPVSQVPS